MRLSSLVREGGAHLQGCVRLNSLVRDGWSTPSGLHELEFSCREGEAHLQACMNLNSWSCHPERSEAESRDLRFRGGTRRTNESFALYQGTSLLVPHSELPVETVILSEASALLFRRAFAAGGRAVEGSAVSSPERDVRRNNSPCIGARVARAARRAMMRRVLLLRKIGRG
jgi:hypothetical protein